MLCEKCGKAHDGLLGNGRFCSRSCANKRIKTEEQKSRMAEIMKKLYQDGKVSFPVLTKEQIDIAIEKSKETWRQKLLSADFSLLTFESIRKRLLIEQSGKCNKCGLSEWMGQPIVLEVDHKDGDNKNNRRENVEAICPNCHSLTPTWRGRNKEQVLKRNSISDEALVRAYLSAGNIRQALIDVGMAAKGANYGRVKRALSMSGIEYKRDLKNGVRG